MRKKLTEEEKLAAEYTELFIKKHCSEMTVKELSVSLEIPRKRIYAILKRKSLTAKKDVIGRTGIACDPEICRNRPQACFTCTSPDCTCNIASNEEETAYLFLGIKTADETHGKRKSKRLEALEDNL